MFGMSFGSSAPQETKREELSAHAEIADTLVEFDFIRTPSSLSEEDYAAIKARAAILESSHVNSEAAIALAYIDRKVNQEKEAGNDPEILVSKVAPELVSSLLSEDRASNEEFVQTVLNLAKAKFKNSEGTFSEALLAAIGEREAALASTPAVSGKIDAQDNVVQPSDEELLR